MWWVCGREVCGVACGGCVGVRVRCVVWACGGCVGVRCVVWACGGCVCEGEGVCVLGWHEIALTIFFTIFFLSY